MTKPHATFKRTMACVPLDLLARVDRLRALSGVDGAKPSESAVLVALIRRGVLAVEAEHGLGPIAAAELPRVAA